MIQLPGRFYTVNSPLFSLRCLGGSHLDAPWKSGRVVNAAVSKVMLALALQKNIFSRFIIAIKVFPSCRKLALVLQQSSGERFLENFEENTHTPHAVFRPRGFRGQTRLGVCK